MDVKHLTYGFDGFDELKSFLIENQRDDYTLSVYDMMTNQTVEVFCNFDDIPDVVSIFASTEHDFPAWIGANPLSDSYVVGMNFTRGRLGDMSICKYDKETGSLVKLR